MAKPTIRCKHCGTQISMITLENLAKLNSKGQQTLGVSHVGKWIHYPVRKKMPDKRYSYKGVRFFGCVYYKAGLPETGRYLSATPTDLPGKEEKNV